MLLPYLFLYSLLVQEVKQSPHIRFVPALGTKVSEEWRPSTSTLWMTEPWTTRDNEYLAVRQKIDSLAKNGQAQATLKTYENLRKQKPHSPLAVFAWAWAYIRAYPQATFKQVGEVARAIENTPSPKNREYTRLRFVIESWKHSGFQKNQLDMGKLGEKLINSDDNETYFIYNKTIDYYISGAAKNHSYFGNAISLGKTSVNKFPSVINAYGNYADSLYFRWIWTKDKTNLNESLKYYKICLNSKNINSISKEWVDVAKKHKIPALEKALRE